MIVQNNPAPWVVLSGIIVIVLIAFGLVLGNSELLNPTRASQEAYARATQGAVQAEATQAYLQPTYAALRATQVVQDQVLQATVAPLQAQATQAAALTHLQEVSFSATQTAIALQVQNDVNAAQAARDQAARQAARAEAETTLYYLVGIVLVIGFLGVCAAAAWGIVSSARSKEKQAQAKLTAEQRRNAQLKAAIREKSNRAAGLPAYRSITPKGSSPTKGGDQGHGQYPTAA